MNMTNALRIDTLAFANRLREAGADERLVAAIVEGLALADISHLATRDDLLATKAELKAEIAGVKGEIAGVKAELKAEIAGVKAELKDEIGKSTIRLLYSQFAFAGAIVVATIGGFMALMP